jgi:Phytanoyl-CoA dioxygenase (PhyH)
MQLPTTPLTSLGLRLETGPEAFGELRDSTNDAGNVAELRRLLTNDGYLLLRGLLDPHEADEARLQILESLAARGQLDPAFPPEQGVAARTAHISKFGFEGEDRRFPAVRRLALSGRMLKFFERFLDAPPRPFDYVWMRLMASGQATAPHCDIVYMGRGTHDLYTVWIPLTSMTLLDGPLMVLERSHLVESLRESYARMDIDKDGNWRRLKFRHGRIFRGGDYSRHPRRTRAELGLRWLTAEFMPGDLVIFTPYTMHASLDNQSRRFRISIDARYQRASDPVDERWIGEHPIAHSRAE